MRSDKSVFTAADGQEVSVVGKHQITVDAADALYEFSVRGLGLTELPEPLARRGIERGDLVHVLPEWSLRPLGIYAVWPDNSRRASLTLIFVRFIAGKESDETLD